MFAPGRFRLLLAPWLMALIAIATRADEPKTPWVDLVAGARMGEVGVEAEGTGDGRVMIRVANRTHRRLKVMLPPGLVASGATGQFAGLGGLGNLGFGGINGGFAGNNGGFGGINGNFGGVNGNFGGINNGLVVGFNAGFGGDRRPKTFPPQVGLGMLGQSIMASTGHPDSWNQIPFAQGIMSMNLASVRGAMNPLQGLLGFRSVPPTDLPAAVLEPGQSRPLVARLVSLGVPAPGSSIRLPAAGERLRLSEIADTGASPRVQAVLRRLAVEKAPETVAQLALWGAAGIGWDEVARASRGWANAHELALATALVDRVDRRAADDSGRLLVEVTPHDPAVDTLAEEVRAALRDRTMLGLAIALEMPDRPVGPAIGCRVRVNGTAAAPEFVVEVMTSDPRGVAWTPFGKFSVPAQLDASGRIDRAGFGDALSEGLLNRLVVAKLTTGNTRSTNGRNQPAYAIRVENNSPLILNGLAIAGEDADQKDALKSLVGIAVSPHRSFLVPASPESVERSGLKHGIRIAALDLSGP